MVLSANNPSLLNLSQIPEANRYFVAYSGGMDSTAVLHALVTVTDLKDKITAIHINHNIDANASQWADHCQAFCDQLGVKLISRSVTLTDHSEDSCRRARQDVFTEQLGEGDCLITGHHLSDQIETVLFRLIRGTGLLGLTGMKVLSKHAHYQIFRPMLNTEKSDIEAYIKQNQLTYITDPSNSDNTYSRNFIRNEIMPLVRSQFPDASKNIALTAKNLQPSAQILGALFKDWNPYKVHSFAKVDKNTFATVIYSWLSHFIELKPSHHALQQFAHDCINAAPDKMPQLNLSNVLLIYWGQKVYALKPRKFNNTETVEYSLHANKPIQLPGHSGSIELLSSHACTLNVVVKFQQPGEKILLANQTMRAKLKNLFQAKQIPPWERQVMPYLYIDDHLMAVGSQFKSAKFTQLLNELNAEYHWRSPQFLL